MTKKPDVRVRRVYNEAEDPDGVRVLVDRIWPRGITKAKAALAEWCKDVAPSTELRKWYGHDPAKFTEFTQRYRTELTQVERGRALQHLQNLAVDHRLTLLTAPVTRPRSAGSAIGLPASGAATWRATVWCEQPMSSAVARNDPVRS